MLNSSAMLYRDAYTQQNIQSDILQACALLNSSVLQLQIFTSVLIPVQSSCIQYWVEFWESHALELSVHWCLFPKSWVAQGCICCLELYPHYPGGKLLIRGECHLELWSHYVHSSIKNFLTSWEHIPYQSPNQIEHHRYLEDIIPRTCIFSRGRLHSSSKLGLKLVASMQCKS